MWPILFLLALGVDDPLDVAALEDALDDGDPAGVRLDRFERRRDDRIVVFERRRDAVTFAVAGSIQWSERESLRRQRWVIQAAFVINFDSFLTPTPRTIGMHRLERERRTRCAALLSGQDRASRARWSALECEVTP